MGLFQGKKPGLPFELLRFLQVGILSQQMVESE